MMQPIPCIRVSGSHYEAGRQIGAACREALARSLAQSREAPPAGRSWQELRQAAAPYLAATSTHLPWIVEELRGAAEGAGMDLLDLAVLGTEEIWSDAAAAEGCSDFAAGPPATANGEVWLAHNNDLSPDVADQL